MNILREIFMSQLLDHSGELLHELIDIDIDSCPCIRMQCLMGCILQIEDKGQKLEEIRSQELIET